MSKTILVVEDNALNMKLFDDVLSAHDFDVIKSVDGSDVVELARKHMPNLIVMDIQLPVKSGLDCTRELKAADDLKHIAVIAVTAFTVTGGIEEVFEAGCDDVLGKPINVQQFLDMVQRYY